MMAVDVARWPGWLSPRLARSGGGTDVHVQIEPECGGARKLGGRARAHCSATETARDVSLVISCSLLGAAALALCCAVPAAVCSSDGFVFLICL